MKSFALYHHPQMGYEAVKQGFSWPGFFFTWLWAFVKKLFAIGAALLVAVIVLRILIETREPALQVLGVLGILVIVLVVGFGGNQWREDKLVKRGYQLVENVQAENPQAAIARMIQRGTASTPTTVVDSGEVSAAAGESVTLRVKDEQTARNLCNDQYFLIGTLMGDGSSEAKRFLEALQRGGKYHYEVRRNSVSGECEVKMWMTTPAQPREEHVTAA